MSGGGVNGDDDRGDGLVMVLDFITKDRNVYWQLLEHYIDAGFPQHLHRGG